MNRTAPAVTAETLLAERRNVARHEIGHALVAALCGWGVGRVSAIRKGNVAGSCDTTPPPRRSELQLKLEEAMIKLGGPSCSAMAPSRYREDLDRATELIREVAFDNDREAEALERWLRVRVEEMLANPSARRLAAELQRSIEAAGYVDLDWPARADSSPAIALTVSPIINVSVPAQEPPSVSVNVEQPDKIVTFERDADGNITQAETAPA